MRSLHLITRSRLQKTRYLRLVGLAVIIASVISFSGCSWVKGLFSSSDKDKQETVEQSQVGDAAQTTPEKESEKASPGGESSTATSTDKTETGKETEKTSPGAASGSADVSVKAVKKPSTEITLQPIPEKQAKPAQEAAKSEAKKPVVTEPPKEALPATAEKKAAPKPKDANHFVITVDEKDSRHPYYGKGHTIGFLVNDVPGNNIVMERGKTYLLEVVTNPLHDVYLSEKEIGWGSAAWTKGVSGQYIYNGIITVKPDKDSPSELYYACRNHPYMGGTIYIVNPGEQAKIKKHSMPSRPTATPMPAAKKITKSMVNQKLMFADLLAKSKTTERVKKSDNAIAKKLQASALDNIEKAKTSLAAGDLDTAFNLADKGVEDLKKVKKLVPSQGQLEHLKSLHTELVQSLDNFEKSHKKAYDRTLKKKGKDAAVDYDHDKVEKLKAEASAAVKGTDYGQANKLLEQAQRMITVAIKKMMDSQTVVYDLNFETPEEEYEYELRRFKGYEILIPIAVKMKKPSAGAKKLMQTYLEKGQKMRDAAVAKAKQKQFAVAITMLLDATKEVRRALRMVGVNQ